MRNLNGIRQRRFELVRHPSEIPRGPQDEQIDVTQANRATRAAVARAAVDRTSSFSRCTRSASASSRSRNTAFEEDAGDLRGRRIPVDRRHSRLCARPRVARRHGQ